MSIAAIIPARGGSKGIPKKNIIDFCGKPLIAWSILCAKRSSVVSDVYVSSDDDEILQISEQYGAIPIKRPDELAQDTSTSEDTIRHFLKTLVSLPDAIVFLQATSPLRKPSDVSRMRLVMISGEYDSVFSATETEDYFIWEETENGLQSLTYDYKNRKRRQDINSRVVENGSIYMFKPEKFLHENNRLHGKIGYSLMEPWQVHEIDNIESLNLCKYYFENKDVRKCYGRV